MDTPNEKSSPVMSNEVISDADWTQTPNSTKRLVIDMAQHISTIAQKSAIKDDERISLSEILHTLRKRWFTILLIFSLTVSVSIVVAYSRTPVYKSSAVLLIKLGKYIYRPEIDDYKGMIDYRQRTAVINADMRILESRNLINDVISSISVKKLYPDMNLASTLIHSSVDNDNKFTRLMTDIIEPESLKAIMNQLHNITSKVYNTLGLKKPEPEASSASPANSVMLKSDNALNHLGNKTEFPELDKNSRIISSEQDSKLVERAITRFLKNYEVETFPESNVINISFQNESPEMAARVVNQVVNLFQEHHIQAFSDPETKTFLEKKVMHYLYNLGQLEEQIKQFKTENHDFFSGDQGHYLQKQRASLMASLSQTRNQIAGLNKRLQHLNTEKILIAENRGPFQIELPQQHQAITEAKFKLLNLELAEQDSLTKFHERHPHVSSIRSQIKLVKNFLRDQEAVSTKNMLLYENEVDIANTRREIRIQEAIAADLEDQIYQLDTELLTIPHKEQKYNDLMREKEIYKENYEVYTKKLEEYLISDEMNRSKIANVRVLQKGFEPSKPMDKRRLMIAVGIFLGAVLGVGSAYVVEHAA